MFGLKGENLFTAVWIGIFLVAIAYSFAKHGYQVWFKPTEFMKSDEEQKKNSPRWIRFFIMSTTAFQDLWIARIAYLLICIIVLLSLVLLVLRTL